MVMASRELCGSCVVVMVWVGGVLASLMRGLHIDRRDRLIYDFITSTNLFKQNWDGFGPEFVVEPSRNCTEKATSIKLTTNQHCFVH